MSAAIATPTALNTGDPRRLDEPLPLVRGLVREILQKSPSFKQLHPDKRRELAVAMVRVCHAGASLVREEWENKHKLQSAGGAQGLAAGAASARSSSPPERRRRALSTAQAAGSDFSGVAAQRVAGTTQAILNAVSFPRFVTDLINGVFKAMISSNIQQMNSYVELLNNVSASLEGFSQNNVGDNGARQWLVDKFPSSFEIVGGGSGSSESDGDGPQLQLRDGAPMPSEAALKAAFGLGDQDSIPSGDPETALLPFARIQMARQRQQMLATMVMLGMQRIVIDSGRITAAMHFHIDTRSAAHDESGSTFSEQNQISASGSYGVGPWGVSASMSNTIGYVSTQKSMTTEEMNTDLDLSSSVELNFKSDYVPLNRMASSDQASRIRANTLNPQAEIDLEKERAKQNASSDSARLASLDKSLQPLPPPSTPAAGAPGSVKAAQDARAKGNASAG